MEKPTNHDRVFIAGSTPGATLVLESKMVADPTLVGYIEQICRELLAIAELELQQQGRVHASMKAVLFEVRDQYNEALGGTEVHDDDKEDEDGDMSLFSRFQTVLNGHVKNKPVGRPFYKSQDFLRQGETAFSGNSNFHRKP